MPPAGSGLGRLGPRLGVAALLLAGITVAVLRVGANGSARAVAIAQPAPPPPTASAPAVDDSTTAEHFTRYALNALLAPLMDDDVPPRWTDIGLHYFCGPSSRVEVDGKPLVPGDRVPATSFTVRWHMDECWPFSFGAVAMSGTVELLVFHDDTGLSAVVSGDRLVIAGATGANQLPMPFTASLSRTTTEDGR
jgi:hypothetical protein